MVDNKKTLEDLQNTIEKIQPMTIPDDWGKLGVEGGYNPLPPEQTRHFILGPSGGGKTTFVSGMPKTLILDFERGACGVPNSKALRVYISDGDHLVSVLKKLAAESKLKDRPFDRIVFDTVDQWIDVMSPYLCKQYTTDKWKGSDITDYGSHGAGYSILRSECWNQIRNLEAQGYAWTCLGHLTEKTQMVNNKERTSVKPVLFDSFAQQIARNSEILGTIRSSQESTPTFREYQGRTVPSGTKQKTVAHLEAQDTESLYGHQSGKRRGVPTMDSKIKLPDPLDGKLGWDAFVAEYNKAVDEVKKLTT